MTVSGLYISPHRTNCFFLCYGVFLLLFIAPYEALAQNNTVTRNNTSNSVTCPSGYKCFSSEIKNVTVELGYNGNLCRGNNAQECYGESDPRGFVAGPRQRPVVIYQGDGLIVKFSEKYNFAAKLYNVSRSAFHSCNFTNAVPVIPVLTKMPFEIPAEYINTTGITYFIAETDNMVIRCQFGLKLEVNVRSREKCISPSLPVHGVCSSKGLCATYGQFFTFNASCVCNTGYLGPYCGERNSCHATLNPCLNEATCIDKKSGLEDDYNCSCVAGYEGKNCENNIDDCKSSPCQNGAICLDELNGYKCLCQPGYLGTNCEKLVADQCELKPCQNGGTCERAGDNRQNYTCNCPQGFQGRNCTENVTISSSVVVYTSILSSTVTEVTSEVLPSLSSSLSTTTVSSLTTVLPVSTLEVVQTSSVNDSSFMDTTSSTLSTVQVSSSPFSVSSSILSVSATPSLTTMVTSRSSVITVEPLSSSSSSSTTVSSSGDVSTPLLTTMVISSPPLITVEPSATATTTVTSSSDVSSSSSSLQLQLSTGPLISTQIIPTSTFLTATSPSSSINPTTLAPTTIPLKEQTCKDNPCNNGTCLEVPDQYGLNFTCQCPKPTYGPRCSTDFKLHFPRFSSGSYLVHKPIAFGAGFNKIVITFKTTAANGLVFYSTHRKYKDFIQLYITEGKLEYRFDPGDYTCVIKSNVAVNTGNIVIAVVTYDSRNKEGSLQVDNNPKQTTTSLGKMVGIGLYNDWYVGGMPPGKTIGSSDGGQTTSTFIGCIKDIELNGDQIGFAEATDWNDISECDTPCNGTHKPCQNNGQCIPDPVDPHDYECKCPVGFKGTNCKNPTVCSGDPCKGGLCIIDKSAVNMSRICLCPFGRGGGDCDTELNITTPKFTMVYNYSSFIRYQVPTLSGPYFDITLQFKIDPNSTAWNNALLMFSGQNEYQGKGDDFIALGINNSRILLQYNLGSGIASIASDAIDTTREWHSLTAGRNGREGYLYLDNQSVKRGSSPGQLTGLNLFSPLYIGGVPDLAELPTDVLFKRGFEGSITNGAVRFRVTQPFIQLLTSQQSNNANEWPVVEGQNVVDDGYNGCNTSQPCQNNGTCTQKGATIVCSCVDGWKGMYCASQELPCVNHNPCAASSTCREVNNKAVCDCPLGKTGDTCSNAISIQRPQFKENSYMAFTPTVSSIRLITQITIKFIPHNENGLLFYVAHKITTQKGDFLSISLHNGFVQYRYDLGSGIDPKQNQRNISLNNEHTVTITRNQQTGTLKVDNETTITVKSPGSAVALDASSNFYLGGVPQLSLVNPSAVADVKSLKDFVGCVTSVTINSISLKLTETGAAEGRNVNNCPASKATDDNVA